VHKELTGIFVFSSPRGGTNLFCALMHNHPSIVSLTHAATKAVLENVGSNTDIFKNAIQIDNDNLIYKKGGIYKNPQENKYVLYDKVHYDRSNNWFYWNAALDLIAAGSALGINVIRHPFAVLSSMNAFHKKYHRLRWAFTLENTAEFYEYFFRRQVALLQDEKIFPIIFESFVKNVSLQYSNLCQFLGLSFENYQADIRMSFEKIGAASGGRFSVKEVSDYSGSNLEKRGILTKPELMYFDEKSGVHTLGRGGFNPYTLIEPERVMHSLNHKSKDHVKIFKKVFGRGMSASDVNYLLNTNELTLERLKEMDMRNLEKYYKRVSFYPKVKRRIKASIG
jgi:hypothetical protein